MAGIVSEGGAERPVMGTRRMRPLAFYLFILGIVALVPAFVFSAILLERNNEAQARVVETLVTGTLRAIVETVEREIDANISMLKVLASTPALTAGDYRSFHTRVRQALLGTDTYIYLLDSSLMSLMSTRVEYGGPARPSADPESGRAALESGEVVVSDVMYGSVSQRFVFNVLLPVFQRDREALVLGLNRSVGDLSDALLANKLPDGWNVALIDSSNQVVAVSPGGGAAGDAFSLADARTVAARPGWTDLSVEGVDYLAAVQRSPLTGWVLFAWAPQELIARPLAEAFWSLLVGGVLLAAVVILIIYWVSLQIGRSVHGLEDDARRLGVGEAVPPRAYPIAEIAAVSDGIADAARRRKAAQAEVRLLMRELAHRSKNQLTVIAAMAKQSAKGATSVPEFVTALEKRIFGLARSTDLLLAQGIAGIALREVLFRQIDPLCPIDSGRVLLDGPIVLVNAQAAQILGMAAHELATNAVKYGAFSTEAGRIEVSWELAGDQLELSWREHGTPVRETPPRRGYGTSVLEDMVGRHLGARVARTVHADGIEWRVSIPQPALEPHGQPAEAPDVPPSSPPEK